MASECKHENICPVCKMCVRCTCTCFQGPITLLAILDLVVVGTDGQGNERSMSVRSAISEGHRHCCVTCNRPLAPLAIVNGQEACGHCEDELAHDLDDIPAEVLL